MDEGLIQTITEEYGLWDKPNTAKYIAMFGTSDMMSKFDLKPPYSTVEEVYGECVKQKVTWKELLDFKGYDENILY